MKPIVIVYACALSLCLPLAAMADSSTQDPPAPSQAQAAQAAPAAPKLHAAMRALWQGHIAHTRAYAMAVKADDAAAAKRTADEVVANAKQIADAVGGFYGAPAGQRMLELLAAHWGGVKALTDAQHAGDSAAAAKARQDLNANATEVAAFLSGANPNLPNDAVHGLMMAHVAHHEAQIEELMRGDVRAEASTWKAMQSHMDTFADALAGGIAKQFPDKAT